VRIWQNPREDFIKSSAGFSEFRKWFENKAIEKRKNLTGVELKLLCRTLRTSLQNFANFSAELCELDWRRPVGSLQKFGNLTGVDLSVDWCVVCHAKAGAFENTFHII